MNLYDENLNQIEVVDNTEVIELLIEQNELLTTQNEISTEQNEWV